MNVTFYWTNDERRRMPCPQAVFAGLKAAGHTVREAIPRGVDATNLDWCDCGFIWNGRHGHRGIVAEKHREADKPLFIMERGFFDRMNHTQIADGGFNHTAPWARTLDEPAPIEGKARFQAVHGEILPTKARDDGYVLILGQTAGDSQLKDSEIHHPKLLIGAVEDALPRDVPVRFRPHPLYPWRGNEHVQRDDGTLREAIDGARFAVTINSNAGNEALAWGCPVLCLGPALYAMAGAALQTTLAKLGRRLECMLGGWHPPQSLIENTLHHLACRQYGLDELRRGERLRRIMEN